MNLVMKSHSDYAEVIKLESNARRVEIPSEYNGMPVRVIADGAFMGKRKLTDVIIPDSVEHIGAYAFANSRNLRYIGPESDSLQDDSSMSDVKEPTHSVLRKVTHVGQRAFSGTALCDVTFEAKRVHIGVSAFSNCASLGRVNFMCAYSVEMEREAFCRSGIHYVGGAGTRVKCLPEAAFFGCVNLTNVHFAKVESVGERCFFGCAKLKTLHTGGEPTVGKWAFVGCDLLSPRPGERGKVPVRDKRPATQGNPDGTISFDPNKSVRDQIEPLGIQEREHSPVRSRWTETDDDDEDEEEETAGLKWFKVGTKWLETMDERPMFRVAIEPYNGQESVSKVLQGRWAVDTSGNYQFFIMAPDFMRNCKLKVAADDEQLHRYLPLLNFCREKVGVTTLLGVADEQGFVVHEMIPFMGSRTWQPDQVKRFVGSLTERLRKGAPCSTTCQEVRGDFIRGSDEVDAFFKVCGGLLPEWVTNAYQKNNRAGGGNDERRHARRATELLVNIDWQATFGKVPTVTEARKILDESFHGLEEVKVRILEVIAQIRRTGTLPKWGILLNGPAGTGKTTIAKAVALLLDMPLIQMDMSSIGEGAESISGSSRIYQNASPGMLLSKLFENRSSTAVLLANELDNTPKSGYSSVNALLTILDKTGFYENFLEEIIPTDNIFCIGTCNNISKLSQPLRDRFLVIDVPPYSKEEKQVIWSQFALPRAMAGANIAPEQLSVTDEAAELLVSGYTVLPGARDLEQSAERLVGNYCRHADEAQAPEDFVREYGVEDIKALFGAPKVLSRHIARRPGQVNSAFYYEGVAHFFLVEASVMPGTGQFKALGPMSELQKEYAKVAYTCVRNTTGMDLNTYDVEVFIPHAIPDSVHNHVGLACYAAICSKLLNTNLALNEACFIGGCDMNGALYFDEYDITPLLRAMRDRNVTTVYAPMGTNCLLEGNVSQSDAVAIVEAMDAGTLFSIAAAQGNHHA